MTKEEQALNQAIEYIDNWMPLLVELDDTPGIAVSIRYKGKLLLEQGYGLAHIEKNETLTAKHVFHVASHSKMFTATAIMQLKEKELINLDDEIIKYLSWLKGHKDKRWQKVTIRQLLGHRAGVLRDGQNANHWNFINTFPAKKELVAMVLESDLIFDTNHIMKYSNIGYGILGQLIEEIAGQTYEQYVQKHILKPLGMKHTSSDFDRQLSPYVTGYRTRENSYRLAYEKGTKTNALAAATGFCSTVGDMSLFGNAQLLGNGQLLDDESKKELQRLHSIAENANKSYYGLGFQPLVSKKGWVAHDGGFPGFSTATIFNSDKKLAVCVFTNYDSGYATSLNLGIVEIIEWFLKNYTKTDKNSTYAGRFYSLRGMFDIITTGKKIAQVYPKQYRPFKEPVILEKVDKDTLKIPESENNFLAPGETIRYRRNKDRVIEVSDSGFSHFPKDIIDKRLQVEMKRGFIKRP